MSRRPKRRSEHPAPMRLAVSGTLVLIAVGVFLYVGIRASNGLPGVSYTRVFADLADIGNLRPHDEVRVAGVRVGQVVRSTARDGGARVELQLDGGLGRLPVDTTAVVRARGLLGARFLELRPGRSARLLAEGATVQAKGVSLTNGVPDVLDTFDAQTRGRLGEMLGGLGQGVALRGDDLNATIAVAPGLADQAVLLSQSIRRRDPAARLLLPSLRAGLGALDGAREDIADGLAPTADGIAPFSQERDATRATLSTAPGALIAVDDGLTTGLRLLASARRLAGAVNRVLPRAPAGLRSTTALLKESPPALRSATSLLHEVRPTVPAVLDVTAALSPTLRPLKQGLDDLTPILRSIGAFGCDVENFAENWRSALGYGSVATTKGAVEIGFLNQFRINALAGVNSISGVAPTARDFIKDREPYMPACLRSPGAEYPLVDGLVR